MHYYVKDYQGNVRQVTDADGNVEQDNHYYPYGMLMAESSDILAAALSNSNKDANPYLYGSKEYLTTAGANLLDFTARTYDPSLPLFQTQDPLSGDYTHFLPYLYCGADPVNRIDRDGRQWEIETLEDDDKLIVKMKLTGVVINTSTKDYDLNKVAEAIENQLKSVYTFSNDDISVTMSAEIRVVTSAEDIEDSDHVFRIHDQSYFKKGRLANTRNSGLLIRLGTKLVEQTLSGENTRTIAHEVGHSGGLHDTNLGYNTLPINDMNSNLMTQIKGLESGTNKNEATILQTNQIRNIVKNYKSGKLNRYSPLKERCSPQFISKWPFFKLSTKYLIK